MQQDDKPLPYWAPVLMGTKVTEREGWSWHPGCLLKELVPHMAWVTWRWEPCNKAGGPKEGADMAVWRNNRKTSVSGANEQGDVEGAGLWALGSGWKWDGSFGQSRAEEWYGLMWDLKDSLLLSGPICRRERMAVLSKLSVLACRVQLQPLYHQSFPCASYRCEVESGNFI